MLLHQIFVTVHCIWALFVWLVWHALDRGLWPQFKYESLHVWSLGAIPISIVWILLWIWLR